MLSDHLECGQAVLVSEDGQQIVAEGVGHVLGPVGVWALSSHQTLDGKALRSAAQRTACQSMRLWGFVTYTSREAQEAPVKHAIAALLDMYTTGC